MNKLTLLTSSLVLAASFSIFSLPVAAQDLTAADRERIEARKSAKTQLPGERIGRTITKALDLYNEEKLDEAIAVLLDADPSGDFDRAFLYRFLGNIYAFKDMQQAIKYLDLAVKPDVLGFTDQSAALKLLADLQIQESKFKVAIDSYQRWMRFTGENDADVYFRIAQAYYQLNDYAKAIPSADNAIRFSKEPNKNHYLMKMGSFYELKRYPETISTVETMVQLFPEEKAYWVYLGNFYTLVEDYDKSLSAYQIAHAQGYLEKESELKALGQMYANNNIPYKAASIYEKYVKSGAIKKDRTMLAAIASNYQAAREFAKAAEYYGELAKLTNEADAFRRQGNALMSIQRYPAAIAAFDAALSRDADRQGGIYINILEAYFYQGKYKEAYAALQNAKKDPSTSRQVRSWESYIRDRAKTKGVTL
jgi:tetratricopeptide (TPR) repeat protein